MEFNGGASFDFGSGFASNSSYTDQDMKEEDDELGVCSDEDNRSSSSVGSRSDLSDDAVDGEGSCKDMETTEAFQQVQPVRKGISRFYSGKSKSFTSLADAVSSASVKELAKPETLHAKKQNDLLARKIPQINSSRTNPCRPFKKFAPSYESCSSSASPPFRLPPLHPQRKRMQNPTSSIPPPQLNCSPWRSFSVSDLQNMVHNA